MYELSVLARAAFSTRPNASGSAYAAEPLDRPEWDGFLPVVTALARWKSARRTRALAQAKAVAPNVQIASMSAAAHPSCS